MTAQMEIHPDNVRITSIFLVWLLGATILAAGLRLYHLDRASFWVDELNTIRVCADLPNMHRSKALGYVPTAFGLWANGVQVSELVADQPEAWRSHGVTEWSARIGSAVFGIITIPILGLLTCRWLGTRVSAVLVLLLAIAPWHIYWSQASRFYTQQFLFYNLCLILYFQATHRGSRLRMALAMVFMILAFLSQPPALVIVAVFAIDWLCQFRHKEPVRLGWFGWVTAIVAMALCALTLSGDVQAKPEDWSLFVGKLYHSPGKIVLGTIFMVGPVVAAFSLLSGWWLASRRGRIGVYLLLGAVVPALAFAATSLATYVGLRYVFVALFCWLALAAVGIEQMYQVVRPRLGRALATAPLILLMGSMMFTNYGYYTSGAGFHARWRDAFEYVAERRADGDTVCAARPIVGKYYLQDASVQPLPKAADGLHAFTKPAWLVNEPMDALHTSMRRAWLTEAAELKAYFDLRVVQPYSSVRVHYYDPKRHAPDDTTTE